MPSNLTKNSHGAGDQKADESIDVGCTGGNGVPNHPLSSVGAPQEDDTTTSNQHVPPIPLSRPLHVCNDSSPSVPAATMPSVAAVTTPQQGRVASTIAGAPMLPCGIMPTGTSNRDTLTSQNAVQATVISSMLLSQVAGSYGYQHATNLYPPQHVTVPPVPEARLPPSRLSSVEGTNASEQRRNAQNDDASSTGRVLFLENDRYEISPYQCLIRQQIEVFEQDNSGENMQGRNRPVRPGQVGIRCRHCGMNPRYRSRSAVLFPSTLLGLYQTAQNMAKIHLIQACLLIPAETRKKIIEARRRENCKNTCKSAYGGGRQYWADSLAVLGIVETPDRGLRFAETDRGRR